MLTNTQIDTGPVPTAATLTPRKIKAITAELLRLITTDGLTTQALSAVMTRHMGGSDAAGIWDWRLAFDLMQVAAGQAASGKTKLAGVSGPSDWQSITCSGSQLALSANGAGGADIARLGALTELMASLPTETRRSERQVQLQQFSTPLDLAFVVALAGRITKSDVVLEPSAGTGALACMAQMFGADLILNELDAIRRALLSASHGRKVTAMVTGHDAEFIDDLARFKRAPSVVLMNPPFASSATRSDPTIALRHVLSALKTLRPGGRLVAIVPPSVSARGDAGLWARLCAIATPVLRLHLPRSAFRKMGTSVSTELLILDKFEADPVANSIDAAAPPVLRCPDHICPDMSAAISILDTHCPSRLPLSSSQRFLRSTGAKCAAAAPGTSAAPGPIRAPRKALRRSGAVMLLPGAGVAQNTAVPLEVELLDTPRVNLPVSDIYASYAPQRLRIAGAGAHPSPLVESLAMGSVHPPQPGKTLVKLPRRIVEDGALSEAQLETILMAETAFASDLPGRFTPDDTERRERTGCLERTGHLERNDDAEDAQAWRRGYFLGDGTGCGKGRQVAGLILAGWFEGRRRALWLSKSATLIEDAIRDWSDLGGARTDIHALSRWKPDEAINITSGILFLTYATLRAVSQSGARRLDQIIAWLGDDFDGVIGFDEAHAMQNAGGGGSSGRGAKAPSQQGLAGLKLQNALPRARCLYVSATGATEVANLAYATRLGLWGPGPGYPFPSRDDFVSSMEAGGVAAMEVVARDLKALGLYTARALSFEGVDYDILEHQLTPDQVSLYDTYASAFKIIHRNLHAALEATGISAGGSSGGSSPDGGKGSAKATGAARSAAISAFEGTKQRLFCHLLQGLKAPAVIAAMRKDIAEGWAPVVQIVSTGEALLKRRLETLGPEDELVEGALTPREYVLGYLERAFPVTQQVLVEQEDGTVLSQPLRDQNGALVISREAEALRQAAMEEIMLLAGVPSALDQIVWAFGAAQVAEVTGRSVRPLKDASGASGHSGADAHSDTLRIERRSASANAAETRAFMAGEKSILIFSDAGGTGRSYHAAAGSSAANAVNQKRRRHYLMEPGWRADAAIQGLGRTHRAAQVSAPFFRVCTSDVHGEKRFTSTIARRLDTLGALTKGQRETASQGMFRASDNLESPIARACLRSLYGDIVRGDAVNARSATCMTLETFCDWTGLTLVTKEGQMLDELPPIQRFLNRVLALPIAMQNSLFAALMAKIDLATERARVAGRLDVGLETLRGDRITAGAAQELRCCEATGAVTSLVPIRVEQRRSYLGAEAALDAYPSLVPMQNSASEAVALVSPKPRQVFDVEGGVGFERRIIRPASGSFMEETRFARSNWEDVDGPSFRKFWDAQVADLPDMEVTELHLLTGLILPIWKQIPGQNTRIYRVQPEVGPALLGRALDAEQAAVLRGRFLSLDVATPEEMLAVVMGTDRAVEPGAGLSLKRRRVAGQMRLEITGAGTAELAWLKSLGCFSEIHQYQLRLFVPVDAAIALRIVTEIVAQQAGRALAAE